MARVRARRDGWIGMSAGAATKARGNAPAPSSFWFILFSVAEPAGQPSIGGIIPLPRLGELFGERNKQRQAVWYDKRAVVVFFQNYGIANSHCRQNDLVHIQFSIFTATP